MKIKKSIAYYRKISPLNIYLLHIPCTLHTGMFNHWLSWLGIGISRIKLKSPNNVSYRLSIGLWRMKVISASRYNQCQNIRIYFKLTRYFFNDASRSAVISVMHDNDIGPLSTSAAKYLRWILICKNIQSENFPTKFPCTFFAMLTNFLLGLVFKKPHFLLPN